jgi:predicted RNA-binding Zn ribbon-like protein
MNVPSVTPVAIAHPQGHAHDADLETCLDFVNTESFDDGVPNEHLVSADDAILWLSTHGLAHEPSLRAQVARDADGLLGRVRAARAALREVWGAEVEHRIPGQGALDTVNAILREAPRIELVAGDDCCGIGHRHTADDPVADALAGLVGPLVRAIAAGETGRFRICANDGCRWVFEDTSRGGRRRWCDMTSCGNRAKVRRFRSKRRSAEGEGIAERAAGDAGQTDEAGEA